MGSNGRRFFDPFGKPRNPNGGSLAPAKLTYLNDINMGSRRGFTDHRHLDEAQLIHMNGRIYDYKVGRFMSVDPFIQSPTNSQSINPYSYIMNNPLSGTDPTGYKTEPLEIVICPPRPTCDAPESEHDRPGDTSEGNKKENSNSGKEKSSNGSESRSPSLGMALRQDILDLQSQSSLSTNKVSSQIEASSSQWASKSAADGQNWNIFRTTDNSNLIEFLGDAGIATTVGGVLADTTAMNLSKSPFWAANTKTKGWQFYSKWKGNGIVNFKSFVSTGVKIAGTISQTFLAIGIGARAGEELIATQEIRSSNQKSSDRQDLFIDIAVMAGAAFVGTPLALIAGIGYFAMDYVYDGRFNEAFKDGSFLRDIKTPFYAIRELW